MPARACWFGALPAELRRGCMPNNISGASQAQTRTTRASQRYRQFKNHLATGLAAGAVVLVLAPLITILTYLVLKGAGSLNLAFFTKIPTPPGETGGGVANAIFWPRIIFLVACIIGGPLGIGVRDLVGA